MEQVFANVVGQVERPFSTYKDFAAKSGSPGGPVLLFSNILRLFFITAGIWAFVNLLVGGFQFMLAGGDSKAIGAAWNRIWQSLIGLLLIVCSFAAAVVFGYIIFGDPGFILSPSLYTP